jgi:hypothetical protein
LLRHVVVDDLLPGLLAHFRGKFFHGESVVIAKLVALAGATIRAL